VTWIPWLAALAPLAYLSASLNPQGASSTNRMSLAAGWLSLTTAGGTLVGALAAGAATSPTLGAVGLGASIRVDALSSVLGSLIAFIGLIVVAYSRNYLAGDPGQPRFIRQLCLTLGLIQALVLSGNLAQLVVCWVAASLSVNRLLLFRSERQAAVLAARKRFLVGRLADVALIGAAVLLWRAAGSGDIGVVLAAAKQGAGLEWGVAAGLLALAAIFSSAQLPFHGWILEVMETPTPVSALLHAGVVNAGGFLVLRFADVVGAHPAALGLLTVVGAASAVFGSLVMLPQTSVKVALAYSTIAQMGFMLLECGLGAYSAALLHIVAHAMYKAHAFLTAGGVAAAPRRTVPVTPAPALAVLAAPAVVGFAALAMTRVGAGPAQQPGVFVLSAVVMLGLAKPWIERRDVHGLLAAAAMSVILIPAYAAGQAIFARITGDLGRPAPPTTASIITATAIVLFMTGLVCLQLRVPGRTGSAAWARAYALVSNGLHLNTFANRWVLRLWPAAPSKANSGAAA
jgi:NAD(P)H-quinone oxidoreductase subunit 5